MAVLKFFIRTTKKNTESNIRIRFTVGRKHDFWAVSQEFIKPEYWNVKKGIVRDVAVFKDKEALQKKLNNLDRHIWREFDLETDKESLPKDWLKITVDKFYNPEKYLTNTTLFGFIKYFTDNAHKRINPKTGKPICYKLQREYKKTFSYLKDYKKLYNLEPDFKDIDLEFYQNFVDMLKSKGLATNTIGKKIQTLKLFLNEAREQGLNHYTKYQSSKFTAPSEESDNIYLNKDEIKQFYEYNLSKHPTLERVRDLFVVGCWTGLRFGDLTRVTPETIKGDFIEIRQGKTGKKVVIPLHSTVKEILNKYNGKLPEPMTNQKFNEYLKKAADKAGIDEPCKKTVFEKGLRIEKTFKKHKLISSHTARRSFCTNAYKDGIPSLAIMAISGHKTERAFLKYIKTDAKEHAEIFYKKWQESGEFLNKAQ